jgi:hypothetical protein
LPISSRQIDETILLPISSRQIEESISIADFFPPNRGVDLYCRFLPAKLIHSFIFISLISHLSSSSLISHRHRHDHERRNNYHHQYEYHYRYRQQHPQQHRQSS